MTQTLKDLLAQKNGFDPQKPLILAVSGGVDSLSLAHALRDSDLPFIVAHLDHALREKSAEQAGQLEQLMSEWGLRFVSRRVDVAAYAKENKLGIEEAARVCRYRFLFEVARENDAQAVVLGHHADDQVETVLMHFMRGSGMAGLTGMYPYTILEQFDKSIPLLRPLLKTKREALEAYASHHQLKPLEDESNQKPVYYRNKLRLELIPNMELLNPGFKQGVLRSAEVLRGDEAILSRLENEAFLKSTRKEAEDEIILDREDVLALDLGIQRRVIRKALNQLRPVNPDFGFEDIEKARALVLAGKGAEDISSGLRIEMLGNYCHLINQGQAPRIINFPQLTSLTEVKQLYVGDALDLNEGWRLHAQLIDAQSYAQMPEATRKNANHAFLRLPKPEVPLQVRAMKAGERWASLGLKTGSQKLSDFFVNNKIPQAARAKWPLVLREESILWVPGLRIAHAWRLKGDETTILHLSLVHNQVFN